LLVVVIHGIDAVIERQYVDKEGSIQATWSSVIVNQILTKLDWVKSIPNACSCWLIDGTS
jgi:hypothetical protein